MTREEFRNFMRLIGAAPVDPKVKGDDELNGLEEVWVEGDPNSSDAELWIWKVDEHVYRFKNLTDVLFL